MFCKLTLDVIGERNLHSLFIYDHLLYMTTFRASPALLHQPFEINYL